MFEVGTAERRGFVATAHALHGMRYGFFFAGAYLYTDRTAPPDVRHSIQTVFGIVILGLGPVLAGFYNEWLEGIGRSGSLAGGAAAPGGAAGAGMLWGPVWWIQAGIGLATALFLLAAFRPGVVAKSNPGGAEPWPQESPEDSPAA